MIVECLMKSFQEIAAGRFRILDEVFFFNNIQIGKGCGPE
jgi:hypothetical protein